MIQAFRYLLSFSLLLAAVHLTGCYEVDNELEEISVYNPADSTSGKSLIEMDSIATSTDEIEFFINVQWENINDTSKVHRIRIHRTGANYVKELRPGEFDYFIDINVAAFSTYEYRFVLLNEDRQESKKSKKYRVTAE